MNASLCRIWTAIFIILAALISGCGPEDITPAPLCSYLPEPAAPPTVPKPDRAPLTLEAVDTDGKKVYHITPEGEQYLDAHRDVLDEIFERVRETVRDFTGGGLGEVQGAFAQLAGTTFRRAWRLGPNDPSLKRVAEILKRAANDIDEVWSAKTGEPS